MQLRPGLRIFFDSAPRFLGAVFCLATLFATSACREKSANPDWSAPGGSTPATTATAEVSEPAAPAQQPDPAPDESATGPPSADRPPLRFVSYNVENWLTMDRRTAGKAQKAAPKPDREKKAVIALLIRHKPDVIGISEVGKAADLEEIREMLKAAGADFPSTHYTGGEDPTRRLGLLSRFPIVTTDKPAELNYRLGGQTFGMSRGILDATVAAPGRNYRFLGVHLKSKRDSEFGDQAAMRLNEGRLLRRHVDRILKADSATRLVVYGDFNDTRAAPTLKTITGKYKDPAYLTAIPARDSNGESWTHFWELHDIYSRFDFILVSSALRPETDFRGSYIINDAEWKAASDHRPVVAIFR